MIQVYVSDGAELLGGGWAALVTPIDDEDTTAEFETFLFRSGPSPSVEPLGYRGIGLAAFDGGLMCVGRLGDTTYIDEQGLRSEQLISSVESHGFLNAARTVGGKVFCVGMWRQVYVWDRETGWAPIHEGCLDERMPPDKVTGFYSIDGTGEDDLWAVGLRGEIWRATKGSWTQISSPTNLMLEQVRMTPHGDVFAAGQCGLLLRGRKEEWTVIQEGATTEDFRGLEWFDGFLYASTSTSVWRYDPTSGVFERLTLSPEAGARFSRLRAGLSRLRLFGGRTVFSSTDGLQWQEEPLSAD